MRIILILVTLAVTAKAAELGYDGSSGGRGPPRPSIPGRVNNLGSSPFRENFGSGAVATRGSRNDASAYGPAGSQPGPGRSSFNIPSRGISSSNSFGRGSPGSSAVTLSDQRDGPHADGSYSFAFQTSDGVQRQESGRPTFSGAVAQEGGYSITYPDGTVGEFQFIADENGFRVESPLLPTPPPLPAHAIQQIEKARREDAQNQGNSQSGFPSHNTVNRGNLGIQQGISGGSFGSNTLGGRNELGAPTHSRQGPSRSQFGNIQGDLQNQPGSNRGNVGSPFPGRPTGGSSSFVGSNRGFGSQSNNIRGGISTQTHGNQNSFGSSGSNRPVGSLPGSAVSSFTSQNHNNFGNTKPQPNNFQNNPNSQFGSSTSGSQSSRRHQGNFGSQGLLQSGSTPGGLQSHQSQRNNRFGSKTIRDQGGITSQNLNSLASFGSQAGRNQGQFNSQLGSTQGRFASRTGINQLQNSNHQAGLRSQQGSHANRGIGSLQGGIRTQQGGSQTSFGSQSDIRKFQRNNNQSGFASHTKINTNQGIRAQSGPNQIRFESQQGGIRTQPGNPLNSFGTQSNIRQSQRHHNQGGFGSQQSGGIQNQHGNPVKTFGTQSNIRQSQRLNNHGRFGSQQSRIQSQTGSPLITFGSHSGIRQTQRHTNQGGFGSQQSGGFRNPLNTFGSHSDIRKSQRHNNQGGFGSELGRIQNQPGSPLGTFGSQAGVKKSQRHNNQDEFGTQLRSNSNQRLGPQTGNRQSSFGPEHGGFSSQSQIGNSQRGFGSQRSNTNQRFKKETVDDKIDSTPEQIVDDINLDTKESNTKIDSDLQSSQPKTSNDNHDSA